MARKLWCMFIVAAWTAVLFVPTVVAMLITLDAGVSIWFCRRLWSPVLVWSSGAKLHITGQEHVDPHRPTVYVSNHQSTLDIPVLFMALPVNLRYIVKKELQYVPLIGWYLMLAGHVFVDRKNRSASISSMDRAAARIRRGTSVIVFPEGTRSDDCAVKPFKSGSFILAIKSGAAIVPITVEGSGQVMPKNSWNIMRGDIHVKIGPPIDAGQYSDEQREELKRHVRDVIIQQSLELGGKGGDPLAAPANAERLASA